MKCSLCNKNPKEIFKCYYHDGHFYESKYLHDPQDHWTCCNKKNFFDQGCKVEYHNEYYQSPFEENIIISYIKKILCIN